MSISQPKIAIICARLPDRNTGMLTVDLAAHSMMHKHFSHANITLYAFDIGNADTYGKSESPYQYKDILQNKETFLASDVFLFWGDFIQSHSYWEYDMKAWIHELEQLSADSYNQKIATQVSNRSKYIFLSELSDVQLKKVLVFGSTIITNDATVTDDSVYMQDFNRFFSKIGAVFFRDALSAAKISPLRDHQPTLGSDCALLLENDDLKSLGGFVQAEQRQGVGVFFGRSPSKAQMMLFSKILSSELKETASWLPWFPSSKKIKFLGKLFSYNAQMEAEKPGVLLSQMSGYKYIITDTYHICVNAWRMGIPAVCIGRGADNAVNSLADKKKEILFEMYGARQLYVFLENIKIPSGMRKEATRIAKVLKNEKYTSEVSETIQVHRTMARQRFLGAMNEAIGRIEQSN